MRIIEIKVNNLNELIGAVVNNKVFKATDKEAAKKPKVHNCSIQETVVRSIANKKGWKPERVAGWLQGIYELSPVAAFSIVLREIAIELDKKYKDHINNCQEIFVVSTLDGRIHKVPKAYIKNFRNFAAFRSIEDAKIACRILRNTLADMFGSDKEQKN